MKIDVTARTEDGDIVFKGSVNRAEVSFLLQYAVNGLMSSGAVLEFTRPEETEDEVRIKFSDKEHQH